MIDGKSHKLKVVVVLQINPMHFLIHNMCRFHGHNCIVIFLKKITIVFERKMSLKKDK